MALESVKKIAEADFPTRWGTFRILGFEGVQAAGQPGCETGPQRRRPCGAGDGRHSRCAAAGAHSFAMPHRRCLRLAALRLPAATGDGAHADRRRGRGNSALRAAGGPRHRPDGQAEGLRVAGPWTRHRGGERGTGLRRRLPRLRLAGRSAEAAGRLAACG